MRKMTRLGILGVVALAAVAFMGSTATMGWDEGGGFFPLPPQPDGACVFADNSCQVIPGTFCRLAGGEFLGPGTTCP
ncbi:MAG: hypothetical protein J5J06_04805 [Phycisphaerae bacterium]|nr:hypothetical protein [Phycisphaerae bacterium]